MNLGGAAVGDFNKDGKMDVAVIDSTANTLTIFLGNGDGTFTQGASYSTGHRPMAIVAVDSNNDGKLDLVVANNNDKSVSSFLGTGDTSGSFVLAGTFSTGVIPPSSLAAGNLDSDGKPDLVVGSVNISAFGVLPGLGNGSFASVRMGSYPGGLPSEGVALADLDGDGKLDLIFSGQPASYYRGNGNLTFQNPLTLDISGYNSIAIADLNGDGHNDVVLSGSLRTGSSVILSDGQGGFLAAKRYAQIPFATGPSATAVAVADLHGDHKLDVITVSSVGGVVQVIRGNGDGTLQGAFAYDFQGTDIAVSQAVGDFNGDGKSDIATLDGAGRLSVLLNTDNYSFSLITPVNYGFESGPITAADVNNDGKMDILVAGQSHISILLGKGDGTFQAPVIIDIPTASFPAHGLIVADLNGDGKPDIAFSSSTPELTPGAGSVTFGILFGNGDGTFQTLQPQDNYSLTSKIFGLLPAADLNGDHKLDIVAVGSNFVAIYLNNGNGVFTTGNVYPLDDSAFGAPAGAIGDLRGIGVNDIVIGVGNSNTPKLNILKGNGDGTFVNSTVALNRGAAGLAVADFDGDGKLDVAVQEFGFDLEIFPGLGTGAFGTPILRQSSSEPMVAVDMAGGGVPDLVTIDTYPMIVPNAGGSKITFKPSTNPAMYGQTVTLTATVQPTVPGIPTATGTVSISDASTLLGAPSLSSGGAAFSTSFAVGTHPISAQFSGDANYFARSLPAITQVVTKATTTASLTSIADPQKAIVPMTFRATISPGTTGSPSGTVTLKDAGTQIATSLLNTQTSSAVFKINNLSLGQHNFVLSYHGDSNFLSSDSAPLAEKVIGFDVSSPRNPRPGRGTSSQSGTGHIRISVTGTVDAPMHLECINLPLGLRCSFSQQDFELNGSQLIDATITREVIHAQRLGISRSPKIPASVEIKATSGGLSKTIILTPQTP